MENNLLLGQHFLVNDAVIKVVKAKQNYHYLYPYLLFSGKVMRPCWYYH